jgi:hypothetical protein
MESVTTLVGKSMKLMIALSKCCAYYLVNKVGVPASDKIPCAFSDLVDATRALLSERSFPAPFAEGFGAILAATDEAHCKIILPNFLVESD